MTQKKTLVELLHDLEQEMLRLGYTESTMRFYRRRWSMLLQFAQEHDEKCFSERLGIAFIEKYFHILEKDFEKTLSQADTQELRIIRIIGDFQLHGTVLRRCCKYKKLLTDPTFISISDRFKSYCETKSYSKVTVEHYVKQSERLMDYLVSQGIKCCKAITLLLLDNYIKTLSGFTYKTVEQNICSIRAFLRFLLSEQEIEKDLASKMPMVQARKQTRIPSVWTKDELKKLIEAIDRGSPKGKRDYAIILLACCLGLRCTDIKNLKQDNFHWEIGSHTVNHINLTTLSDEAMDYELGQSKADLVNHGLNIKSFDHPCLRPYTKAPPQMGILAASNLAPLFFHHPLESFESFVR